MVDRKGSSIALLPPLQVYMRPSLDFVDDRHVVTAPTAASGPDAMLDVWELGKDRPVRTIFGPRQGGEEFQNHPAAFCLSRDRSRLAVIVSEAFQSQSLALVNTHTWSVKFLEMSKLQNSAPRPQP